MKSFVRRVIVAIILTLIIAGFIFYARHRMAVKTASLVEELRSAVLSEREAWQVEAEKALQRGCVWLLTMQQENGSWSEPNFPALTALSLWGLQGATDEVTRAACDRAVTFILSCARPDGGIYVDMPLRKGGGLSTYNTAICMSALQQTGRPDLVPVLQNARSFLAGVQYRGEDKAHQGGFGYDALRQRPYTDINNTYFALEAMRLTQSVEDLRPQGGQVVDIDWSAAMSYVSSLQAKAEVGAANQGGFIYNSLDPKAGTETNAAGHTVAIAYGTASFVGMTALLYGGVAPQDPRIEAVVDYLSRNWSLTENPSMGAQGLYFYYNIMARALSLAGLETIPGKDGGAPVLWREALARQLISLQKENGSWVNDAGRFSESDPVLTTSYVLVALQQILSK